MKTRLYKDYQADVEIQCPEVQEQVQKDVQKLNEEIPKLRSQADPETKLQSVMGVQQLIRKVVKSFVNGSDMSMLKRHAAQKTNLATEIEEACKPDRERFVEGNDNDDFIEWLKRAKPNSEYMPDELLLGGQQYIRKYAFIVDVLPRKFGEPTFFSDNDVRNAMGGLKNGRPDREQAILHLVRECISSDLKAALDWFVNAVGLDFQKYWRLACSDVQNEKKDDSHVQRLAYYPRLWEYLTRTFNLGLSKFLQKAREQLEINVKPKTSQLRPNVLHKYKLWNQDPQGSLSHDSSHRHMDTEDPEKHKDDFLRELNHNRCSKPFPSSFCNAEDRLCASEDIKEIKDAATKYVLALTHEIIGELEWHLHHLFKNFEESLDSSDLIASDDSFKELCQLVREADQHKLDTVISNKEKELKDKQAFVEEVSKYFDTQKKHLLAKL